MDNDNIISPSKFRGTTTMQMRRVLFVVGCVALGNAAGLENAAAQDPPAGSASNDLRPNILFLFADDQAFHTIAATGNDEIQTPNLDRLFDRGTRFSHAYNMGGWNGAICIASRTMLNTGLSLWDAEQASKTLKSEWVPKNRFWSQRLKQAGYQTFFTGKWHVSAPNEKVFEISRHVRGGMPQQVTQGYDRPRSKDDKQWLPWDQQWGGFWEGGRHWSEVVADDAVDYLTIAAGDKRPFFMYVAFNAPHDPRQSPQRFVEKYPADQIQVPRSFLPEYPYDIGSNKVRDEKLAPFPRTHWSVQVNRQEYYAIITHMDEQIGRILDHLEQSGLADNTWIFFTADHGLSCGNHGLLGKQNQFDHSIRVPFVVVGPGVENRTIDSKVYFQSVMPTTLELAGAAVPETVYFRSLLPALTSGSSIEDMDVYSGYTKTQRSIVSESMKLICYPKIRVSLLYDLKNDPEELRDLSSRDGSFQIKKRLLQKLVAQQKSLHDGVDLVAAFPELAAGL